MPGAPARWLEEVRARSVLEVATALGLEVSERRGHGAGPCPACGAETRHTRNRDKRGAIGFRPDGLGWNCFQCEAKGDGVDLVAFLALGKRPAGGDREGWAQVRATAAAAGLCERDTRDGAPPVRRLPPPAPRKTPAPPSRPPATEVNALWVGCCPVTEAAEVVTYLESRKLDPGAVELFDLARALPVGAAVPVWAKSKGVAWGVTANGFRLVFPMVGASGQMESLRARALDKAEAGDLKAGAPTGFEVRGLVLADGLGARMLTGDLKAAELVRAGGLVVAEGEPDFLTWATRQSDAAENCFAVVGVESGAWSAELAARVPSGTRVALRTHLDAAGEAYAAAVISTLANRCKVRRLKGIAHAA